MLIKRMAFLPHGILKVWSAHARNKEIESKTCKLGEKSLPLVWFQERQVSCIYMVIWTKSCFIWYGLHVSNVYHGNVSWCVIKGVIFCAAHHAAYSKIYFSWNSDYIIECNFFVISVSLIVMYFTVSDINGELSRGRYGFWWRIQLRGTTFYTDSYMNFFMLNLLFTIHCM